MGTAAFPGCLEELGVVGASVDRDDPPPPALDRKMPSNTTATTAAAATIARRIGGEMRERRRAHARGPTGRSGTTTATRASAPHRGHRSASFGNRARQLGHSSIPSPPVEAYGRDAEHGTIEP